MSLFEGRTARRVKDRALGEKRPPLTIVGYYGFGNLGDEVLRQVLSETLERVGFSRLFILVSTPGRSGEVNRANPLAVLCAMRRSSAVVFGGGGLLQNRTSRRSLGYYLALIFLARVAQRPILLLGQGIGPIQGRCARYVTRGALRHVRRVGCRDRGSLAFVESLGLTGVLDGDLFFLLPPLEEDGRRARRATPRIVLALKGTGAAVPRVDIQESARFLRELHARRHASFTLFVSFPKEDLALARAVQAQVQVPCRVVAPRTLGEASEELLAADLVISARLHALEIGLRAGIPLLALDEEAKITGFVEEVQAVTGLEIPSSSTLSPDVALHALDHAPGRSELLAAYRALHERTTRAFESAVESLGRDTGRDL